MKKFYFKFRIMLMTFAFGLASVFMLNGSLKFSDEVYVNLPKTESGSVLEISTSKNMLFSTEGQGCGLINKYGGRGGTTVFQSSFYGQKVVIESICHNDKKGAKRELELRIKEAKKVLASEEISENKERVILETNDNTKWFDILNFDGEKCFTIISAPNLEPALEFEKLQESQN